MLLPFKAIGLFLLFAVCVGTGFLKSLSLKKRADKLSLLSRSINQLSQYIRSDAGEIQRLINICFDSHLVDIKDGKFVFEKSFLEPEDTALLEEFFKDLGSKDIEGEYERTLLYASLTEKQFAEADEKCNQLCRLYKTLGVLCGVFICIFFI